MEFFTDLVSGSSTSFNMSTTEFESEADSKGITTFAMEVVPSMVGTQAAKATIKMSSYDDEAKALKASMNIDVTMPFKKIKHTNGVCVVCKIISYKKFRM